MRRIVLGITIASYLAIPVSRARAQIDLSGQALEDSTKQPLVGLQVGLWRFIGSDDSMLVDTARTDERGLFQLGTHVRGRYQLRFGSWSMPFARGPVDTITSDSTLQRAYRLPLLRLSASHAFDLTQVDVVALPIGGRIVPTYPDSLLKLCVDGDVMASVVVDAEGKAEMATFRVESASNHDFVDAVRAAYASARFTPAEIGGVRVRQLVTSPSQFRAACRQ